MKHFFIHTTLSFLLVTPLFVHADEASSTPHEDSVVASSTLSVKRSFTVCSQEAIERRDTNIASSRSLYNIAMANALKERKNREKAAVAIADEDDKKSAIKTSVTSYKNAVKMAQSELTVARKEAWQTFEDDIASCRTEQEQEESAETTPLDTTSSTTEVIKKPHEETETKTVKESFFESIKSFFGGKRGE